MKLPENYTLTNIGGPIVLLEMTFVSGRMAPGGSKSSVHHDL
jgi:hypothetical protein